MSDTRTSAKDKQEKTDLPAKPARDPFARMRVADLYWIQLKPVFKNRKMTQPERLARVTVFHDQAAHLEVLRLQIQLEGEPLAEGANHMEVLVDHRNQRVRFAPVSGLRMQPAQRGMGGFLLAQLIQWCQHRYGEYAVAPIQLQDASTAGEEVMQVRGKLLSRAGFEVSEPEDPTAVGHARAAKVEELISQWNSERIGMVHVAELLGQLREQEALNLKQTAQTAQLQRTIDLYKSNDTGQRFAIGCLIAFAVFQALMLLWIVLT
ncbi:hypothetical protein [uncultured Halopseudomonas sp.]|uniref:hypothetical protein n=1 Tax=uncultured Halopseudomonas sp. TaxID=2901193 RepID=UPI0030EEA2B6|tara:strand:- start:18893 stop:19684 length:792 start_codon:yes stop_codon:yes gene_type:complete